MHCGKQSRPTVASTPCFVAVRHIGLLAASRWFLLNSCPDITPLAWWRRGPDYCDGGRQATAAAAASDYTLPPLLPISAVRVHVCVRVCTRVSVGMCVFSLLAPSGATLLSLHNRTTEGYCASFFSFYLCKLFSPSFSSKSPSSSPGFLSNQNHMRCKFTGKLRSPLG